MGSEDPKKREALVFIFDLCGVGELTCFWIEFAKKKSILVTLRRDEQPVEYAQPLGKCLNRAMVPASNTEARAGTRQHAGAAG